MNHTPKKQKSMDMTSGSITKLLIMFAVPLVIGNLFQQLYNTLDSLVVGNFVGSHALAAVGSTTSIINMIVMFFTGTSVGAGVVISRYYGAHDDEKLHIAVETTMALRNSPDRTRHLGRPVYAGIHVHTGGCPSVCVRVP